MNRNRWKILPPSPTEDLRRSPLPPLLAQLLHNRGIIDPASQAAFIEAGAGLRNDPFSLPDMPQAVHRIYRAFLSGEHIVVFGDFDADGVTSTVLLVEGLEALGARVTPYLPHRHQEGHGLSAAAIREFALEGVSLVITADCGVTNHEEVLTAKGLGVDVLVTDHHAVPAELPACPVVNPKRKDSSYPYEHLAGVGVAFKLLEAIAASLDREVDLDSALGLVALGTIADVSPLTGENRYLVKHGLEALNATGRAGILALLSCAGVQQGKVSAGTVGWSLAPRINAAGRIDHAKVAYQLLHTFSPEQAGELALQVDQMNRQRQALVEECLKRAREIVLSSQVGEPLLFVCDPSFPSTVCGLVAGKLVDEFGSPAVVLQRGEEHTRGSCRSIPGFNMMAPLEACSQMLSKYGGHAAAAGFTVATGLLDELRAQMVGMAGEALSGLDLTPELLIDAEADPSDMVNARAPEMLKKLEPFGKGNPEPVFMARGCEVVDARVVGNGGQHLKLRLRKGRAVWPAICFDLGSRSKEISGRVDIAFNLKVNAWKGNETVELDVADFRPAS